jgi:hypothetical protein
LTDQQETDFLSKFLEHFGTAYPDSFVRKFAEKVFAPTQGADARPVALTDDQILDLVVEFAPSHEPDPNIPGDSFNALGFARDLLATRDATPVVDARPVAIYQIRASRFVSDWTDVSTLDPRFHDYPEELRRIVYATRDAAPSDAAIDALKWIKVLVCGDSNPRWSNAYQTSISRGMIADIVDKAIAAIAPREKT